MQDAKAPAVSPKPRLKTIRRLGDAELMSDGSSVFIGDLIRVAGVELVKVGEDGKGTFEG